MESADRRRASVALGLVLAGLLGVPHTASPTTSRAPASSRCESVFAAGVKSASTPVIDQPRDRLLEELVQLRVQIEEAKESGKAEVAKLLYAAYRQKYLEARQLRVDIEGDLARLQAKARVEAAEETRVETEKLAQLVEHEQALLFWNRTEVIRPHNGMGIGVRRILAYSPDGRFFATAGYWIDEIVAVWDAIQLKPIYVAHADPRYVDSKALSARFSPDSKRIVFGSAEGSVSVLDVESGRELAQLPSEVRGFRHFLQELTGSVGSIHFSRDGRRLITVSHSTVMVRDAQTFKTLKTFKKYKRAFLAGDLSPDDHRVALVASEFSTFASYPTSSPAEVLVWDSSTGQVVQTLRKADHRLYLAKYSVDGKILITAAVNMNTGRHSLVLWDAETYQELRTMADEEYPFSSLEVHPHGETFIALLQVGHAASWSLRAGPQPLHQTLDLGKTAAISPDGKTMLITSDQLSNIDVYRKK